MEDHAGLAVRLREPDRQRLDRSLLSEIVGADTSLGVNPPRMTLRLAAYHDGVGYEVKFTYMRRLTLNPFAQNETAKDLIARARRARSGGAV